MIVSMLCLRNTSCACLTDETEELYMAFWPTCYTTHLHAHKIIVMHAKACARPQDTVTSTQA
jgi:hypothetical protein